MDQALRENLIHQGRHVPPLRVPTMLSAAELDELAWSNTNSPAADILVALGRTPEMAVQALRPRFGADVTDKDLVKKALQNFNNFLTGIGE